MANSTLISLSLEADKPYCPRGIVRVPADRVVEDRDRLLPNSNPFDCLTHGLARSRLDSVTVEIDADGGLKELRLRNRVKLAIEDLELHAILGSKALGCNGLVL